MVARRLGLPVLAVVCVGAWVLGFAVSSALAFEAHPYEESFGSGGAAGSTFSEARPGAVAVDQGTGSIYVGDGYFDESVSKFNLAHEPEPFTGLASNIVGGTLTGFGSMRQLAVDSASHVLYVAGGSPVRAYQPDGEPADFTAGPGAASNELPGSEVCGVAVDSSGDVYVSELSNGVSVFASSGEPLTTIAASGVCNLAVDSQGTVYANVLGVVQKFTSSGPPPVSSSITYEPAATVDENPSFTLAVDPGTDHLLVDEGNQVAEYDQSGKRLGAFGDSVPGRLASQEGYGTGVAVNGVSGRVYVAQGSFEGQVEVFGAAILLPDVTTGEASEINPKGAEALNGAVNPDGVALTECEFEYVEAAHYEPAASDPYAKGAVAPCVPASGSIPPSGETAVQAQVTGLNSGVTYHFRLKAANTNGPNFGADAVFQTPPRPSIDAASADNVTATSVDLNAQINPGGREATYYFEYDTIPYKTGEGEHAHGTSVGNGTIPAGTSDVSVGPVHVTELHHDVPYYWRVVATNEAGTSISVDHTFVYDTSGESLPDNRAYEMVTPPQKNAALIGPSLGVPLDLSEEGSRLMVPAIQCFAGSESCMASHGSIGALFLFSRTSSGWRTTPLSPSASQFEANSYWTESAEAGTVLFSMSTPPMLEDDFYARGTDGSFVDVGPGTPPSGGAQSAQWFSSPVLATSDLSRVLYREGPFWSFAEGAGETPYEFSGTGNLAPVLVGVSGGPGSTDLISKCSTVVGGSSNGVNRGALSADGETVYFTAEPCGSGTGANANTPVPVGELYARIGEERTVEISEPSAFSVAAPYRGCSSESCVKDVNEQANWSSALFAGASDDGSKVFFTSGQQLTDEASQGASNLYEYDLNSSSAESVIDASAGDTSGHGPRVQGVMAISSDGSHVYFVASGVLSTTVNRQGETAKDGANNLYLFERDPNHPGGHVAFIAQLPASDQAQWAKSGEEGVANVTPDGRFLVFESHADLTPDVTRANGAIQIFRYDAQRSELVRISVGEHGFDDDGNAGVGDANIVMASADWRHAGAARSDPTMSHDGSFIFFQSPIGLTPHALNDVQVAVRNGEPIYAENVYEWHEGQVYLISDGRDANSAKLRACPSSSAVCLIGSDATGRNVFFTTADPLAAQDTDTQLDYYDARICTTVEPCISQPPQSLPPCLGEACHGTPATQLGAPSAGTVTFNGQGNVSEPPVKTVKAGKGKRKRVVECARGKRRVHGRCVKAKTKRGGKSGKAKPHKGGK